MATTTADQRTPPSVAGVILAGGRGERLGGRDKALIEIGGATLLARLRLSLASCRPLLLSVGAQGIAPADLPVVSDLPTGYGGPLAGVAAAIEELRPTPPDLLLTVAVDTPFFPADFLARAMALAADADAVVAAFAGQPYPTNALWRFPVIAGLPGRLRDGTAPRSLKRLLAEAGAVPLDYAGLAESDPFVSINTPSDLQRARDRWAAEGM